MDNNERISSLELKNMNIIDWTNKKPLGNASFYHYTTIDSANKILSCEYMYASSILKTNDNNEKKRYADTDCKMYILCFCNSDTEKIPMWYLYSGISGKGIRLGLTASKMCSLIESITTIHPVYDNSVNHYITLQKDEDFTINYGWVFYSQYPTNARIRFKSNSYVLSDSIDNFEKDNDFIKNYEWNYEREFRIVIKIINNKINCDKVAIKINPYSFKLKVAPENENKTELLKMDGFKKYLENIIEDSCLRISMNLINKDLNSIIECIEATKDKTVIERLKEIINNK